MISWYRPPTNEIDISTFEEIRDIIKELEQDEKEIISVGDTNCDLKNMSYGNSRQLQQIYSEYQFEQLIKKHTRIAVTSNKKGEQKTSRTLIDHFATNKYILIAGALEIAMVDHYLVYGIRKVNAWRLNRSKPNFIETRNMKRYTKDSFRRDLSDIDWDAMLSSASGVNAKAATFQEVFEVIVNTHTPLRKQKVRSEIAPWLSSSIRHLMIKRDRMKKEAKKAPDYGRTTNNSVMK